MKEIKIVPYDPNWPHAFKVETNLIQMSIGDNFLEIHHIGSTAVPELIAKPKIDIILVVKDPFLARVQLEKINFQYRGEYNIPLHYGFSKRGQIDFNLHVYEKSHPEIELNLMFRNYLRQNPIERDAYGQLKKSLLQNESSHKKENALFSNYTLRKGDFIREILKKSGFNRFRILKCSDEKEWAAAKYFRDKYFFEPHGIKDPYTWTFNHSEHTHLNFYEGVEIVGYIHIQFWSDNRAAIRIIAVEENKRSKNLGSQFLSLIENWLKKINVKSIHAESRQSSLNFYLKNGYEKMSFNDPEGHESDASDVPVGKIIS